MQIVIGIPAQIYDWIEHTGVVHHEDCGYLGGAILDGITIPDNATNGDVIKTMFPHYDIEVNEQKNYVQVFYDSFYTTYPLRWWLKPYKENDTEESDAEFMCKAMSKTINKSTDDRNFIGGF